MHQNPNVRPKMADEKLSFLENREPLRSHQMKASTFDHLAETVTRMAVEFVEGPISRKNAMTDLIDRPELLPAHRDKVTDGRAESHQRGEVNVERHVGGAGRGLGKATEHARRPAHLQKNTHLPRSLPSDGLSWDTVP